MRGRNIFWLSLVAMLLIVPMISVGSGEIIIDTKLKITPSRVPGTPAFGHPGEEFWIAIEVEKAVDLYSAGFKVDFAPYASILAASMVFEGNFLKQGGYPTFFTYDINIFKGEVNIGITRLGYPPVGVSGDGVLATFKLTVLEAGSCPLLLKDSVLIDSTGASMPHLLRESEYVGSTAQLVRLSLGSRATRVGEAQSFNVKVRNEGDLPLEVQARIDNMRLSDGKKVSVFTGQTFNTAPPRAPETYWVDGYDGTRQQWTEYGTAPFLSDEDTTNYIEGTVEGAQHRWFSFEDIDLSDGANIKTVRLYGYTNGPYDESIDYDIYSQNFAWLGSLYGTGTGWSWVTTRWVDPDETVDVLDPSILTEAGFNNFAVLVYGYGPCGPGNLISALKLEVEFYPPLDPVTPPIYTLYPGDSVDLGAAVWTPLRPEDIGQYMTTVTVYFTYMGSTWNMAEKTMTRSWWIEIPPE